jgi:outer membrane protein assembly factor BamD
MFKGNARVAVGLLLASLTAACASAPPYRGMTGDELFALGAEKFEEQDWGKAVEVFERLVFANPSFPRMPEARLYLARAYYNRGEYITSVAEFRRILERHPGDPLAPEASLGVCKAFVALSPDVERDQDYTEQAWNACENTVSDFAGSAVAVEAAALRDRMESKLAHKVFIGGDFYYKRKLYPSGIIYFNRILDEYPRNEWAAEALLRLYQSYAALNWDTEAEEAKQRLLRDFPDSDAAAKIRSGGGEGGPAAGPSLIGLFPAGPSAARPWPAVSPEGLCPDAGNPPPLSRDS